METSIGYTLRGRPFTTYTSSKTPKKSLRDPEIVKRARFREMKPTQLMERISLKRNNGNGDLLTDAERLHLIAQAKKGDRSAMDHLLFFHRHLIRKFAVSALKKTHNDNMPLEDLVQIGMVKFMDLVLKFREDGGAKYGTYLYKSLPWHLLSEAKRDTGVIHVSDMQLSLSYRIKKAVSGLAQELMREPTEEEVALRMGMGAERVRTINERNIRSISTETELCDCEDLTLSSKLGAIAGTTPHSELEKAELLSYLDRSVKESGLTIGEKLVIRRHLLEEKPFNDIGRELGFSRAMAHKVFSGAMRKLRCGPYGSELERFLK